MLGIRFQNLVFDLQHLLYIYRCILLRGGDCDGVGYRDQWVLVVVVAEVYGGLVRLENYFFLLLASELFLEEFPNLQVVEENHQEVRHILFFLKLTVVDNVVEVDDACFLKVSIFDCYLILLEDDILYMGQFCTNEARFQNYNKGDNKLIVRQKQIRLKKEKKK